MKNFGKGWQWVMDQESGYYFAHTRWVSFALATLESWRGLSEGSLGNFIPLRCISPLGKRQGYAWENGVRTFVKIDCDDMSRGFSCRGYSNPWYPLQSGFERVQPARPHVSEHQVCLDSIIELLLRQDWLWSSWGLHFDVIDASVSVLNKAASTWLSDSRPGKLIASVTPYLWPLWWGIEVTMY